MFFQSSETCIQDHETNEYVLLFVHSSNHNTGFRDNSTTVERGQDDQVYKIVDFWPQACYH